MPLFSDRYIKALEPKEKPYIVTEDCAQRGIGRFQIKVLPSGRKQFMIQYFAGGQRTQMSIGNYGAYSLAAARKEFSELSAQVQQGLNPKRELEQKRIDEDIKAEEQRRRRSELKTFKELWADFRASIAPQTKQQAIKSMDWMYNSDVDPFIPDDLLAKDFTQDHVRALLKRILDRGAPHKANNLHGRLKTCFKFGLSADNSPARFGMPVMYGLESNPCANVPLPHSKGSQPRDRALSEDEVKYLWNAPRDVIRNRVHHLYFKLQLALAGQRVVEVYHSKHSEWDLKNKVLEIPADRIKVQRRGTHVVPISDLAERLYLEIKMLTGGSVFLFPHRDREDIPSPHASLCLTFNRIRDESSFLTPFTPRDIRRTAKTLMSKCGVERLYRDMLQQHDEIDNAAQKNYDKYDYLKEKRAAMDLWTAYLKGLVGES